MPTVYNSAFYEHRHRATSHAAEVVLGIVHNFGVPMNSAIDIGCGVGAWLKTIEDRGAARTRGYEGPWLPKQMYTAAGELVLADLNTLNIDTSEKYDIAICLEVFEHLTMAGCESIASQLAAVTDTILFSAAPPAQGGNGHINERPLSDWIKLFEGKGFNAIDDIRWRIWGDDEIPYWYRQNIVLFSKHLAARMHPPVDVIHPAALRAATEGSVTGGLVRVYKGLVKRIKP